MKKKVGIFVLFLLLIIWPAEKMKAAETSTPSGIPFQNLEEFVDKYVEDYIGTSVAGASIVILKEGEIVLSKGYGYSDVSKKVPVDPASTVFEWGSISKLVVWTAVMQLVEEGKLDLNADIQSYLPDNFLSKLTFSEPITMLHLMNHNAGFEDRVFDLGFASETQVKSLEEGLRIAEPRQVYRPGEVVAYSNYSTSLAAFVVERVTTKKFHEYAAENIFSKVGIDNSAVYLPTKENLSVFTKKAVGYELLQPSQFKPSTPFYMSLYPSGGINGTAEDLALFAKALMPSLEKEGNRLFHNESTLDELLSTSYQANSNMPGVAHGFWEYNGKYRGVTHAGNTTSFSGNLHIVPEDHFAVMILTNQAGEIDLSYGLIKEIVGEKKHKIGDDLPDADEVSGTYITARRMHSGFLSVYYYLSPLKISPLSSDRIKVSISGRTATYVQTEAYVYRMEKGDNLFLPNQDFYFEVENSKVKKISTSISDYLPLDKSIPFLKVSLAMFILVIVYSFGMTILLMFIMLKKKLKKEVYSPISVWYFALNFCSTALLINIMVLALRMLQNSDRAYSEIILHIWLNYGLTAACVFLSFQLAVKWKKAGLSALQKAVYVLAIGNFLILFVLMIIWEFYS